LEQNSNKTKTKTKKQKKNKKQNKKGRKKKKKTFNNLSSVAYSFQSNNVRQFLPGISELF